MSATSQGQRAQPTFTIEQIELIRRLRNSGLTKEQVVQAFDSFERVDAELGNLYTAPISLSQQKSFTAAGALMRPVNNINNNNHQQQTSIARPPPPSSTSTTQPVQTLTNGLNQSSDAQYSRPNGQNQSSDVLYSGPNGQNQSSDAQYARPLSVASLLGSVKRRSLSSGVKRARSEEEGASAGSTTDIIRLSMKEFAPEATQVNLFPGKVSPDDVDDFLKQDREEMHAEVREYLFATPTIVHNDIATTAGVALSCVSKFLVGNFSALPSDVLRQLSLWFLSVWPYKKKTKQRTGPRPILPRPPPPQQLQQCNLQTTQLLQDIIQERINCGVPTTSAANNNTAQHLVGQELNEQEPDQKMDVKPFDGFQGLSGGSGMGEVDGLMVNFTPRRERFTFRKKHLEVLETYFKTNQYPTFEERTEIAQRCNDIMEVVVGRGLADKEKMTPQNVAYWFSNRRKDIKRMAREGGLEMSEVVLPSKLKQSPEPLSILDNETASSYWAMDTSSTGYSPLGMPSVGPVAFPTMVQRSFSETNASADTGSVSSDSQGDVLSIKQEPLESESVSSVVTNGPGSAVERIAAEISSQLASKTGAASTNSEIKSSPVEVEHNSGTAVKSECPDEEPESH
ncbi:homeobox-containing protein 1-like isoform X2 [Littorina saxatilis]|uniref:homeobox-containing protein 1-like isoform X2 n=1 Tax=Littorina saxatilis TaxID=31220 RepID=UPI0038B4A43C